MKKIILLFLGLLISYTSFAQVRTEKTILFLIPFYTEQANQISLDTIHSEEDMFAFKSFDLVGFWEGAQMAIEEYNKKFVNLNVVVRDVTNNSAQLQQILQDVCSKHKVDLIIGPFYGKMFAEAATFAKERRIPIVNPFGTKSSLIENNEFVYKVLPPTSCYPPLVDTLLIRKYPNNNVILWVDNKSNVTEQKEYENYFTNHNIPFKKVSVSENVDAIRNSLKPHCQNIVIALFQDEALVINHLQNSNLQDFSKPITLIVPEKWMNIQNIDLESFNRLNIHYFSNYFVDYKEDKTEYFSVNFIDRYNYPPDVKHYSLQGYDITKYFLQKMFHDSDERFPNNNFFSLGFNFKKQANGGYENQRARLLMIENYEKVEIK